jgi:hypothetical protein
VVVFGSDRHSVADLSRESYPAKPVHLCQGRFSNVSKSMALSS